MLFGRRFIRGSLGAEVQEVCVKLCPRCSLSQAPWLSCYQCCQSRDVQGTQRLWVQTLPSSDTG